MPSESFANTRRPESNKTARFAIALGVLALLAAVYTVIRIDVLRDRISTLRDAVRELTDTQSVLRASNDKLSSEANALRAQLAELTQLQKDFGALASSVDELRGRTDRPQRTWARAEALYLLQLAERQLQFTHNVSTAIVAVEAADARLAEMRDPALSSVRTQIAKDLQALRAVVEPDRNGLMLQLERAYTQVPRLKIAGTVPGEEHGADPAALPDSGVARAWTLLKRTVSNLFAVRQLSGPSAQLVSADEQALRGQHLQLLLSSAKQALDNDDRTAYRSALSNAAAWLQQYFDQSDPAVRALASDLATLHAVEIAPPLPSVAQSARLLERFVSGTSPP